MQSAIGESSRGITPTGSTEERLAEGDTALAQSKLELMTAFEDLIEEGKLFVKSTSGVSGDAVEGARERLASRLADARDRWSDWSQVARVRGREVALATDDYVHEKPWLAVALVAGAAFVIATLTTRR
jgi:ElaB/YqjD/DUF883 family membrane-anchored ribosome-binding protein